MSNGFFNDLKYQNASIPRLKFSKNKLVFLANYYLIEPADPFKDGDKSAAYKEMMRTKHFLIVILLLLFLSAWSAAQKSSGNSCVTSAKQAKTSSPKALSPRAVIMTTDIGAETDDQWTLAQLALAPEFELRGVVTTHAPSLQNPAAETSARRAREVLERLPITIKPTVYAGSSQPLINKLTARRNHAVEFIIQQAKSFSSQKRLIVLVTGAATDVASALLLDPSIGKRVEIVAMGFDNWQTGNDSWNIKNDLAAWQVVMESSANLVVGDASVTKRYLAVTRAQADEMLGRRGLIGRYLVNLYHSWLDRDPTFIESITGSRDKWIIWDSVTLAYLLGLTKNKIYQRPILRDDLSFLHLPQNKNRRKLIWVTTIDEKSLWQHFTLNLDRANSQYKNFNELKSSD